VAESSEKADIESVVDKFNVKMSRMYIVEREHHCTNYSARKLKGIGLNGKSRNLIKLGHKIERIEEIYEYLETKSTRSLANSSVIKIDYRLK
jgi:hypothetical protein